MSRVPYRFLNRLAVFLAPIALYFVVTLGLLWLGGELTSPTQAAQLQKDDPALVYGRAYHDDFRYFKFVSTQLRAPQVLALGSSRVMEFRSGMFVGGNSVFYNAGGGAASIYEVLSFLQQLLPAELPKVLIVGLDQDWFQPGNAAVARNSAPWPITAPQTSFAETINMTRLMLLDLINQRRAFDRILRGLDPIYGGPAIGINAITIGSGFRSDGSYLPGPFISPTSYTPASMLDTSIARVLDRIHANCCRFEEGTLHDEGALQEVEALEQFCQANHIGLVLFAPPYAPSVYTEIVSTGKYNYMFVASSRLADLSRKYNVAYYDLMNGSNFGADDTFIDGLHGSESTYLEILLAILKDHQSPLRPYVNMDDLNAALQRPRSNPLEVYGAITR
jgi:hypothetical protein